MTANQNSNPKGRETKMDSPLRSTLEEENYSSAPESPAENHQREKSPPPPPSKMIVALDRYSYGHGLGHGSSPQRSPKESPTPEVQQQQQQPQPQPQQRNVGVKPVVVVNRSMREELAVVNKMEAGGGGDGFGTGHVVEDGVLERRSRAVASILKRSRTEALVKSAALGIRVCEVVLCLISFSVMGADKTRGWAGDSFDRYKEYRYCLTMNVIGFVYAGFQAYDMAFHLITAKHVIRHPLRVHFDFSLDQMLTYLLISASSSAATRVDDWESNWGKDAFTEMASASIAMSFLAFIAFSISSLISGYYLCTRNFT
ncbi:hypothetical protein NE237_008103 [Protea cynaroides]|uniref:CASP-like protein n=1 Tax=Protea cynaroides TaxID=273540 RepID=A0A9Q0KQS4_9MAGN|nr:hypothetical protein NE237_008103 [Protea cynaroides]